MAKMVVFGHGQWHGWSLAKSRSKEMTVTDSPSMAGCSIKQTNKQKQNRQTNLQHTATVIMGRLDMQVGDRLNLGLRR